jgi:hypothetical protein
MLKGQRDMFNAKMKEENGNANLFLDNAATQRYDF